MGVFSEIGSSILLYFLVFGMSATVDIKKLFKQLRNRNALLTGISLQFVILPLLGFLVVKALNLSAPLGITLLVVTSSPGGSYSNWWCSLFNADLALSVTMTTISTLLSVVMLPTNLILYATTSYSNDVVKSLDWAALFLSLVVVIGGIASGLICSATIKSKKFNRLANKLGNIAGISLVTYSAIVSSTDHNASLWDQDTIFYFAVAAPCLIGLMIATWMVSWFKLDKPERVAVAIECSYQNTGIATSVAITMFQGEDLATAVGVPLFYGICEAGFLAIYCVWMWKLGWTKAPRDANICVVIATSYEIQEMDEPDPESIEVVLGKDGMNDLIFSATNEGYQIDEESLHSLAESEENSAKRSHSISDDSTCRPQTGTDDMDDTATSGHFTIEEIEDLDEGDREVVVDTDGGGRHRGRQYSAVDAESPSASKSTKHLNGDAFIESNGNSQTTSSGNNRIGQVIDGALRPRSKGKYTKATNVRMEEDHEGLDNASSQFSNVLAAGKEID